jgi:hypothetical protein
MASGDNTHTTFPDNQFRHSSNIKVITSAISEAEMLVLMMEKI